MKRQIPRVSEASRKYVEEVLDFGFHNCSSPGISARLEKAFAEKFDVGYAILHCNGTATMHSALMAAGVGVGDEVIVPGLTMASTAFVALHVNAIPIFADIDPDAFTIDPADIRRKVTPRTKAIIPVSIYGLSPDMDAINDIAREYNLTVIEDNAECFLGYYKDRLVGTMGHMASFSFQASKHMTCGDGGVLITDDEELAFKARRVAVLGYSAISPKPGQSTIPEELRCHPTFARHAELGYNFRMPEIASAVALGELERLEELVEMRQACAQILDDVVKSCSWIKPQAVPDGYISSYWTYAAYLTDGAPDWAAFRAKFVELGGDGFYGCWLPVYKEPAFQNLSALVKTDPTRYPQYAGILPDYRETDCPFVDRLQPKIVQLKTNYFDLDDAEREAKILAATIRFFS